MISHGKKIKIFTGNSHPELAKEIADLLGLPLGNAKVSTFSDGEISVDINETVRGVDVFIVQSTSSPVNNNLMELLIIKNQNNYKNILIKTYQGSSSVSTITKQMVNHILNSYSYSQEQFPEYTYFKIKYL